jgi:hypothetical protein
MDQKQFDAMLSDGETRLQRLKMLYEQWFLGFERIEPAILRKEFEDLLAMLRREQVANTALRFRLQGLVQRHTTFATHWRRVARQIEDGTYQRDVLRARRVREQAAERDNAGPELELSYDVDLDDELQAALEEANREAELASAKRQPTATQPRPSVAGPADAEPVPVNAGANGSRNAGPRAISPFALPSAAGGPAKAPALQPAAAKLLGSIAPANDTRAGAAGAAASAASGAAGGASAKALGATAAAGAVAAPGTRANVASAPASVATNAKAVGASGASGTNAKAAGTPTASGTNAKAAGTPTASGANAKAAGAPTASGANANVAGTPAGASGASATVGSAATNGAAALPGSAAAARAGAGAGARATAALALSAAAAAARSGGSAAGANGAKVASAASAGPSAKAAVPVAATQAAVAPKPAALTAAASGSAAFSNDDVQRIYTQYVSARKQNAERVDNIKLDSIEKTLRGMLPQLEKKHIGKKIDFEVVVKDGKVALKPVAR